MANPKRRSASSAFSETSQELAWQPTNSTGRKFSRARAGARGLAGLACSPGRRHGRVVARAPGRCGNGRELGARRIVRGGGGWQTQNGGAHRAPSRKRAKNLPGSQPTAQAVNSAAPAQALADWPGLPALLDAATGASWLALQVGAATGESWEQGASFAVVADGKPKTAERIERLLANEPRTCLAANQQHRP